MKIAVACDHAGFPLNAAILAAVRLAGHEPIDLGTDSTEPVDYPDYAEKIGRALQSGAAQRGILLCGSGVGAGIAANKLQGVYAGVCHDSYSAHQGVEHDDMNLLCLGARIVGPDLAEELTVTFLKAQFFKDEERHVRRVGKIRKLESMHS